MSRLSRFGALLLASICFIGSTGVSADDVTYIDVRTIAEFNQGHIAGALLMPHDQISTLIPETKLDKASAIVLYCHSGRRAGIARQTLIDMGYTQVSNAGGYRELAAQLESKECIPGTC